MKKILFLVLVLVITFAVMNTFMFAAGNTKCPVMNRDVDKTFYSDVNGHRVYVCCPMCVKAVKENPDKYIAKLKKMGQTIEKLESKTRPKKVMKKIIKGNKYCPIMGGKVDKNQFVDAVKTACYKCGNIKGSDNCCKNAKSDKSKCDKTKSGCKIKLDSLKTDKKCNSCGGCGVW